MNKRKEQQYIPSPVIINKKAFRPDVLEILDLLAKNVHEEWSAGRMNEGWKFGKTMNDALKEHPALVPYEELPESEKEYDRRTVLATLMGLINNGYEIRKL